MYLFTFLFYLIILFYLFFFFFFYFFFFLGGGVMRWNKVSSLGIVLFYSDVMLA